MPGAPCWMGETALMATMVGETALRVGMVANPMAAIMVGDAGGDTALMAATVGGAALMAATVGGAVLMAATVGGAALVASTVGGAALVVGEVLLFFGDVGRLDIIESVAISALGRERERLLGVIIPLSASMWRSERVFAWLVFQSVPQQMLKNVLCDCQPIVVSHLCGENN